MGSTETSKTEKKESSRSKSRSMQKRAVIRGNFLRAHYRRLILATIFSLVCNAVGVLTLLWTFSWRPTDSYIPTYGDYRVLAEPPLNEIYGSENDVTKFADTVVRSIFMYDYKNFVSQFATSQQYFTDAGWKKFAEGMKFSGALEMVKKNKMIVSVEVQGAPVIQKVEDFGGRKGWTVVIPNVRVTYESGDPRVSPISQPRTVEVIVLRTPLKEHAVGYAIAQITEKQE